MDRNNALTLLFSVVCLLSRLGAYISSPLYLDYFEHTPPSEENGTLIQTDNTPDFKSDVQQSQPFFKALMETLVPTILWGVILALIMIVSPQHIGKMEESYPKIQLATPAFAMALSAILTNHSLSGARTAPSIQAVLSNFAIPIQFVVRFIILRRRPTLRKGLCAVMVVLAEFICLSPTIFTNLEPADQRVEDRGATGAGAILWPICVVSSLIPLTIVNTLVERSVQENVTSSATRRAQERPLNMVFYLFAFEVYSTAGIIALFWTDILPGFGTSSNVNIFWEKFKFNMQCAFSGEACSPGAGVLLWICTFCNTTGLLSTSYLLRYSEGANYMMIILTLRSPLLLLFWTLFHEQPFKWSPHIHLSTWLSLAALVIMIPSVLIYNSGPPEKGRSKPASESSHGEQGLPLLNADNLDHMGTHRYVRPQKKNRKHSSQRLKPKTNYGYRKLSEEPSPLNS